MDQLYSSHRWTPYFEVSDRRMSSSQCANVATEFIPLICTASAWSLVSLIASPRESSDQLSVADILILSPFGLPQGGRRCPRGFKKHSVDPKNDHFHCRSLPRLKIATLNLVSV